MNWQGPQKKHLKGERKTPNEIPRSFSMEKTGRKNVVFFLGGKQVDGGDTGERSEG